MDTPTTPSPPPRAYDGFYRRPGRKTKLATFRVYQEDLADLKARYNDNMSLVIRILLDQFINGHLPSVDAILKQQFEQKVEV